MLRVLLPDSTLHGVYNFLRRKDQSEMDRELLIYLHLKLNQNLLIIQFFGSRIATTEILSLKDAVYLYQS